MMKAKSYEILKDAAKEVWNTLIITHQGNSQVKDCKIDLLTQKFKKLSISDEETIDSGFTRFNAIVTSLKSLDQDYSSKNHVRKFFHALPLKWRDNVTTSKEAKDLSTLPLDELIGNLKVYEMILENNGVASKTTKEKVKSLALKAKVTREQTSNDSDSHRGGSEEAVEIALGTKEVKALDKGEVVTIARKKATSLVSVQSPRRTRLLSEELSEDGDKPQNDATCLMTIDSQENASYAVSKKIYSKNILEDDKRGPYSKETPIRHIDLNGYGVST
ncbi:hypothetical protein Tco_1163019 [Tanacetum coccineum]